MPRSLSAEYWDETIETATVDAVRSLQLSRLRSQLARLAKQSDFYRDRLASVGFEVGDLKSLDDLPRLPFVTKEELRTDQEAHPPFGRFVACPREDWAELHPSTGTTGRPVNTIWSRKDVTSITDFTARTLWQMGVRPSDTVQNAFAYGLWVAGMSVHYAVPHLGAFCVPVGAAVHTERQIAFLIDARSTVLLATPSYGMHIAEVMRQMKIAPESLSLRIGAFGGESGTENDATRSKLETGLGIDAFDYYGLAEVGPTFASECKAKSGIHFTDDHMLVESIDPETKRPVADGQLGVLVFTHLTREATPMVRYWSNDYARLDHSVCACGRTHTRARGGIVGRHDDLVIFKGAKFYPGQVEKIVRAFRNLSDEFRIELTREASGSSQIAICTIVVESSPTTDDVNIDELRRALRAELGVTPNIRVAPYGSLERTTFKARRIIDLTTP